MAKRQKQQAKVDQSSPMEQYLAGKISAEQYVALVAQNSAFDALRRDSEKRVRRILKAVEA